MSYDEDITAMNHLLSHLKMFYVCSEITGKSSEIVRHDRLFINFGHDIRDGLHGGTSCHNSTLWWMLVLIIKITIPVDSSCLICMEKWYFTFLYDVWLKKYACYRFALEIQDGRQNGGQIDSMGHLWAQYMTHVYLLSTCYLLLCFSRLKNSKHIRLYTK